MKDRCFVKFVNEMEDTGTFADRGRGHGGDGTAAWFLTAGLC